MYRGRLWTMRQFAGFGTVEETNERFHYLLDHGQTGLSTAFDMPTLMGYDSDHARSLGEVGREGVAVDTLDDMEQLFDGIPLGGVTTSMTINAPAAILLAFYVLVGEQQGVPPEKLGGTIQTDILKEYIAQKEWCFPIEPAMRLVTDMIEWCTENMPRWHPVSISGYHIREAGSTAQQELAFTLKDGFTYVERALERGLDVDDFAPRLSFFFNAHIDFFEEIAKYRAARRIWAREMRDTYGAKREESMRLRFHAQTAGVSLTAQQPLNNVVRTSLEALAGGARRHPVAAHQLLRRGAGAADRGGGPGRAAHPADHRPRVRRHQHRRPARRLLVRREADRRDGGGRLRLLRPHRRAGRDGRGDPPQLPPARDRRRRLHLPAELDERKRIVVGVNDFVQEDEEPTPILRIDPALEAQAGRPPARRPGPSATAPRSRRALAELKRAAATEENLMPPIIAAARARATEGEMIAAMQEVFGTYTESPVF